MPKPLPDGREGEETSELGTLEDDSKEPGGVADLKKMERNAEDGRE